MKAHAFLAALAIAILPLAATAQDVGAKVYMNGMKSAVMVLNLESGSQGSGSVINLRDGYVLTNWHVVRGATDMLIVFPLWDKGRPVVESDLYRAQARKIGQLGKVVCSDQKIDLAVIKLNDVSKIPKGTESVRFAAESPFAGNKIYSIGNPGASEALWIYTPGDVRQVYKKKWESGSRGKVVGEHEARIIEATSLTSGGDSGGPCFNDKGEQVGVCQGGLNAIIAQGFSYFIDVSEVRTFLKGKKIAFNSATDDGMSETIDPKAKTPDPKENVAATVEPKKETPKIDPAIEELARQEKAAAGMLNLIRPLTKDPNKHSFAADKLKQIVKLYPKTEAAKEAQTLLKQLQ
jgi:hypothetical protein